MDTDFLLADQRESPEGTPPGRRVFFQIAAIALIARLVLWLIGLVSIIDLSGWLDLWSRWDAPHYLRIAEVGYRPLSKATGDDGLFIVFFPLFPLAVRIVALAVRNLIGSALVVSYFSSVGAGWFLYRLARLDTDHRTAFRCVLVLFAFPTAYFMAAPYTEALFLFTLLAAVYAARTNRWLLAGLAGAGAGLTRIAGLALFPTLGWEAMRARSRLKAFASVALAGAGPLIYLLINQIVYGTPFAFLDIQHNHWDQRLAAPWRPLMEAVQAIAAGGLSRDFTIIYWGRLAGVIFAVLILVLGWRALRVGDRIYGVVALLLVMSASWLLSLPRYLLGIYPIFLAAGRLTRRPAVLAAALTVGIAMQATFFWFYARGWWTF